MSHLKYSLANLLHPLIFIFLPTLIVFAPLIPVWYLQRLFLLLFLLCPISVPFHPPFPTLIQGINSGSSFLFLPVLGIFFLFPVNIPCSMLSMRNSTYLAHPDYSPALQDNSRPCPGSPSEIPTLSSIARHIRANTSSSNTSTSSDDTSIDSPDFTGSPSGPSPPTEVDAQTNILSGSHHDSALSSTTQPVGMNTWPKVEELDEDDLQSIKTTEAGNEYEQEHLHHETGVPVAVPRKRGRPRKHPLPTPGGQLKVTKGRSKTGCITCRRRKKKCDESFHVRPR